MELQYSMTTEMATCPDRAESQLCNTLANEEESQKFDSKLHSKKQKPEDAKTLPEIFACSLCEKSYKTKSHLTRHMKVHSSKMFQCKECSKSFFYKDGLVGHMRIHTKERPYLCELCGRTFTDMSWLYRHKMAHSGERKFVCNICKKGFTTRKVLTSHTQRIHQKNSNLWECKECGKSYTSQIGWYMHMRYHNDERLRCSYCGKKFSSVTCLRRHERLHTGEKPFDCKICGKRFPSSNDAKVHNYNNHTDASLRRKYECTSCKKVYLSRKSLTHHRCEKLIRHNTVQYKCNSCKMLYLTLDSLTQHKCLVFNCNLCKQQFMTVTERNNHEETHTYEEWTKFVCEKCGRRFRWKGLLKRHTCFPLSKSNSEYISAVYERMGKKTSEANKKVEYNSPKKSTHRVPFQGDEKFVSNKQNTGNVSETRNDMKPEESSSFADLEAVGIGMSMSKSGIGGGAAEIKQEVDWNNSAAQEMTYVFKINENEISLCRP